MFTLTINNTEYVVRWRHNVHVSEDEQTGTTVEIGKRREVGKKPDGKPLYEELTISMGRSRTHPKDQWNRKKGTRAALTIALNKQTRIEGHGKNRKEVVDFPGFDREERTAFWQAFENTQIDPWGK